MADEVLNAGGDAGIDTGANGGGETSLRDQLAAALAGDGDGGGAGPAPGAAAQAAQPQAQQQQGAQPAPAGQQPRTDGGQFAKKAEPAQNPLSEPPKPQGAVTPPDQGTSRIPPGLSAATKAAWNTLPQHVREDMQKWQGDLDTAKTTWDQKAERFNRLDAILAPRRERFQLAGIDETQAVQALFAAQDLLERDPVNALLYLARQSGVGPQHLAQALGMNQQQQPQVHPQLQGLMQQVEALTNAQAQQQAQVVQSRRTENLNQVQAFAADPKNVFFENVRERMAKLIRAEEAADIADAYDKACWSDPEIRPLLLSQQAQQQQGAAQAAASAKAEQARRASGSVIGSPTHGATPAGGSSGNLRGDLQAAWDANAN